MASTQVNWEQQLVKTVSLESIRHCQVLRSASFVLQEHFRAVLES